MIKVAHVITGLGTGGAETMLLKLLSHTDRERFAPSVYSLMTSPGPIPGAIDALGIPVVSLGMSDGAPDPRAVLRLSRLLRADAPDLVQTWMYHADLVGGIAAKTAAPRVPVVWNIRLSNPERARVRRRTIHLIRLCAKLSTWLPHTIICCSAEARRVHAAIGYRDAKMRVIPNGFDLAKFRPDPGMRGEVRAELRIPDEAWVIGMVARFDPQKDHRTLIEAAARLRAHRRDVHLILCGKDASEENQELVAWIDAAGLRPVCHLLGRRWDVPRLVAAMDIASLSSVDEGFPNVIGEAMACGVPAVATDVGETAWLIGDTGRVVPSRDPAALAAAWQELLEMGRPCLQALGEKARRRIEERFSIRDVARSYEATYLSALGATESRVTAPGATALGPGT